jgi:hypothetical protein
LSPCSPMAIPESRPLTPGRVSVRRRAVLRASGKTTTTCLPDGVVGGLHHEGPAVASAYRGGRSPDWLKMKNPACAAMKREVEEDSGG